jgi:hypothetical protein
MDDPAHLELQLKRRNGADRAHVFRQRKKRGTFKTSTKTFGE